MFAISETRTTEITRELLEVRGWNIARPPTGQLLWHNEYRNHSHLMDVLRGKGKKGRGGDGYPDFVVVETASRRPLIVGEAKADPDDIDAAISEASEIYGEAFFEKGLNVLAAGIAGNDRSNISIKIQKRGPKIWQPIQFQKTPIQWIPGPDETDKLLDDTRLFELDPRVPSQEVLARYGDDINRKLRHCKIKDEFRPAVMGAFMLALWQSKGDIRLNSQYVLIDINHACREAFRKAGKSRLAESILVPEANEKLSYEAPRIIHILRLLNITTLTHAHDYLGQLYESFFRFTGGNTIGQYFTPRHITEFMTDLVKVGHSDFVLDPACGTGGFLVASLYRMTRGLNLTHSQISTHVTDHLRGFESEPITAALCVANMILRGDGKTGIVNDDCFTAQDFPKSKATIALGNPPFPHKSSDDPSEKFVDRALEALQARGQLAFVIPGSLLVKSTKETWRKSVLKKHTLKAVITLPSDLFAPYAHATTAIIILEKGVPHQSDSKAFFCRIDNDGFKIKKNVRVERRGEKLTAAMKAYHEGLEIPGFSSRKTCDSKDWSPGAFINAARPSKDDLQEQVDLLFRNQTAFCALHSHELASYRVALSTKTLSVKKYLPKKASTCLRGPFREGTIGDKFEIIYGQRELHSKDWLAKGGSLVISSSGIDNGCYGFFDYADLLEPPFVTVPSTGSIGEAFVQTWPCGVTDDCLILVPKKGTDLELLYLAAAVVRFEKWRFNYGRKITPQRIAAFEIPKPESLFCWIKKRILEIRKLQERMIMEGSVGIQLRFKELAEEWKSQRGPTSAIGKMTIQPAYRQIIRLGEAVVPLILAELEERPDHWFPALNEITGENPVPKEAQGKLLQMTSSWVKWGKEKGFAW